MAILITSSEMFPGALSWELTFLFVPTKGFYSIPSWNRYWCRQDWMTFSPLLFLFVLSNTEPWCQFFASEWTGHYFFFFSKNLLLKRVSNVEIWRSNIAKKIHQTFFPSSMLLLCEYFWFLYQQLNIQLCNLIPTDK